MVRGGSGAGRTWGWQGAGIAIAVAAVLGLSGCSQKSGGNATGTTQPTTTTTTAGATASGSPGASGTATASPGPSGTAVALPESCADVLTLDELDQATGRPVPGQSLLIEGQGEPKINRTGRVTCRFGVHKVGKKTVVPVEVGLSAYSDVGSATDRVDFTVNDQRGNGATPSIVSLGSVQGTTLISASSALLVFAKGQQTAAISITKDIATGAKAKDILVKLGTAVVGHLPG